LSFGPNDLTQQTIEVVRRDTGSKENVSLNNLVSSFGKLLEDIQENMFQKAKKLRDEQLGKATSWQEFMNQLDQRHMVLAPSCDEQTCEEKVKQRSKEDSEKGSSDLQQIKAQRESQGNKIKELKSAKADKAIIDKEVQILLQLKAKEESISKGSTVPTPQQTQAPQEEGIIKLSGAAKSLCKPFEQPTLNPGTPCFQCGSNAKCWILWGRSY